MSKRFYTDIDLRYNKLLKSVLENVNSTDSTALGTLSPGRVFYATDLGSIAFYDGTNVRQVFLFGDLLDPHNINQTGYDSTENVFLVKQIEKDAWNQLVSDSTDFELVTNKNQPNGYAGLDSSGLLLLQSLWPGMVVQDGTDYKTLGQLLDQPNGIPTLDSTGLLDPFKIAQDSTDRLFVTQSEKDSWNSISLDATSYELVTNKNQPDGYAGLDSTGFLQISQIPEGLIIRKYKTVTYSFGGVLNSFDQFNYTFENEPTKYFSPDATNPDLDTVLTTIVNTINTSSPENSRISASYDTTANIITVVGLNEGDNWNLNIGYFSGGGSISITKETTQPAWYDLSNIGGIPSLGFAPLNSLGVIDNKYLPNYRDIVVKDTYADLLAIPQEDIFNGLRVVVLDASDDTSNDGTGWAEYVYLTSIPGWLRTAEKESSVDFEHNSAKNIQGDGNQFTPKQHYHLTDAQWQQVKNSEYTIKLSNINATNSSLILTLDATNYRGAKIAINVEDKANQSVLFTNLDFFFDGNFPSVSRYGDLGSALTKEIYFIPDRVINNLYLYIKTDSTDVNVFMRVRNIEAIDISIDPVLTPASDLIASNNLYPDNVYPDGFGGLTPSNTITPGFIVPSDGV